MSKAVTFGEIMLRLSPEGYGRFIQAERFEAVYGGGEANVAVSLSNFGIDTAFVTRVPRNEIGQAAINALRRYGVNTEYIARGGDRLGIYFMEKGASQRPSKVIYDRANSSIATAGSEDFNWDVIFKDAQWFHLPDNPGHKRQRGTAVRRSLQCGKTLRAHRKLRPELPQEPLEP